MYFVIVVYSFYICGCDNRKNSLFQIKHWNRSLFIYELMGLFMNAQESIQGNKYSQAQSWIIRHPRLHLLHQRKFDSWHIPTPRSSRRHLKSSVSSFVIILRISVSSVSDPHLRDHCHSQLHRHRHRCLRGKHWLYRFFFLTIILFIFFVFTNCGFIDRFEWVPSTQTPGVVTKGNKTAINI